MLSTTVATNAACAWCARPAPTNVPLCGRCLRTLEHVCYGKTPFSVGTAKTIACRESQLPGKENTVAYQCPVCWTWHTGLTSVPGAANHADAVLIGLTLKRQYPDWLDALAIGWRPPLADRTEWRTRVSLHRAQAPQPAVAA